jgi:hypothetical protein
MSTRPRFAVVLLASSALAACRPAPRIEPEPAPASAVTTAPAPSTSAASAVPSAPVPEPDPHPWPAGYTPPEVWETHPVLVDGVTETWSLRWQKPPRFNGCDPWANCACAGLEWGLKGALELVRDRPGAPVERLDLGALRYGYAQIPGFEERPGDRKTAATLEEVVKRPRVQAMALGDYDHDGRATEFVFQTEYLACGNNLSVLVGISRAEPRLHVFHTVEKPDEPLVMNYLSSWEKLRKARGKIVDLPLISCNDHGGAGASYLTFRIDPAAGLHFVEQVYLDCASLSRGSGRR